MRTLLAPAAFGFAIILVSVPFAAPPASTGDVRMEFVDAATAEAEMVRRIGEIATRWLGAKLVYEVNSTLAQSDAEDAVAICHLKSIASGGQVLPGMPSITAIKLTSLRLLNTANAPDAAEHATLDRVHRAIKAGESPPDLLVQRLTKPDGASEWRVYRPIAVLPTCLACHGDAATQSPALQQLLRERASDDAATGYRVGEWRGLLRVTVTPPAAR